MADLAAANVTLTQVGKSELGRSSKRSVFDVTFGNGTLTYPANGIPLPTIDKFGFKRNLESLRIVSATVRGFVYEYDTANHKILMFTQGAVVGSGGSETMDDFPVTAGVGVTADMHLSLKAGGATKQWGPLTQVIGGAPAATTLRVEVRGW